MRTFCLALVALLICGAVAPSTSHAAVRAPHSEASAAAPAPRAHVIGRSFTLRSRNRVAIRLACPRRSCRGRLLVRSIRARHGKRAALGGVRFRLKRGRGTVKVRVARKIARKVLTRGRARVLVVAQTRTGRRMVSSRRVAWIVAPGQPPPPIPPESGPNRIKADASRLYDSVTGATFKPRGANLVRLRSTASGMTYHSTFEPGLFKPVGARHALDRLRADGYNTVRVFVDPGSMVPGEPHGIGRGPGTSDVIYGPYMDNFASFVAMAAERGIYVLPALDHFPQNDRYWGLVAAGQGPGGAPNMAGNNLSYLDKGHVAAKAEYLKQFASALSARIGAAGSRAILAYAADNELFFEANKAPYDKMSGTVTVVNGLTYDMANPAQRQQSADASMVEYSHRIKRALLQVDPEALLTIGFFTNRAVGKSGYDGFQTFCSTSCTPGVDYRVPGRPAALSIYGVADFLDIHAYPAASPWNATAELDTVERSLFKKPWIIGELGALKSVYGGDITRAAFAMRDAQIATCRLGAQGWLFWTFDTHENLASQPLFFHLDEMRGAINGQLAPVVRGDPCA